MYTCQRFLVLGFRSRQILRFDTQNIAQSSPLLQLTPIIIIGMSKIIAELFVERGKELRASLRFGVIITLIIDIAGP
jgi:hypothetical protein